MQGLILCKDETKVINKDRRRKHSIETKKKDKDQL